MLKLLVLICLTHMGDPAYRDREKWTSLLIALNNTFDCRKIIIKEHFAFDLEVRERTETVLKSYIKANDLFPKNKDDYPTIVDFGVEK